MDLAVVAKSTGMVVSVIKLGPVRCPLDVSRAVEARAAASLQEPRDPTTEAWRWLP